MKKLILCLMTSFLALTFVPMQLKAEGQVTMAAAKPVETTEVNTLLCRMEEIKATDKSELSSTEKKQLRKEVRSIKSRLAELDPGVYAGAGGVVFVALLLILLL